MGFDYLNNITLEETLALFQEKIGHYPLETEVIDVKDGLGRITAQAIYANISAPHYNACAMDGISTCAAKTFGATATTPVVLAPGDFMRVDTGDPLGSEHDCVIMIEDVIEKEDGNVELFAAATPWQHVRQIGEDICAGEMILPSNTKITPSAIGAMLAAGVLQVPVKKKVVIGIIPTGDEIVSACASPKEGEIIEFNSSIFSSMVREWGAQPKVYPIVKDIFEEIQAMVSRAAQECDMILLNAGSSAGREDFSAAVLKSLGELWTHGVAIKPGKPALFGQINGKIYGGIPGYPVSGIIVLEKLIKPIYEYIVGYNLEKRPTVQAKMARKLNSTLKYCEFVRVKLSKQHGELYATPLNRGAGVVTSFVKADGLMKVDMDSEGLEVGQQVEVELLKPIEQIEQTISVIGSHDPLLDEISDIIRQTFQGQYLESSHVGSMGGIMAVKRREADFGGIHLLDEETGVYNLSYVKKFFPQNDVKIIRGVKRIQGFMTGKGNPKNIRSIEDICQPGISYVNRQKGSGTRILLDYLLNKAHIDPDVIYGYDREEFTHMSVAAQVASGSGDVGLGIYSAAQAFHLDFVPVCDEQYDFLVSQAFYESEQFAMFLKVITSREFAERLKAMGGYKLDGIGSVVDY